MSKSDSNIPPFQSLSKDTIKVLFVVDNKSTQTQYRTKGGPYSLKDVVNDAFNSLLKKNGML